jgi:hypothetical protein
MSKVLIRNVALFGGMIVAGLVCAQAAPYLVSPRGDRGPTVFLAQQPIAAALALVVCLALTTLLAGIVGRTVNAIVGVFVLGAGVFALDSRLTSLRELAFASPDRSTLFGLAIETAVLAVVALMMVWIVFRMSGGMGDVEPREDGSRPHWLVSDAALKCAAAGIIVLPAVWVLAQTPLKGQVIAAAFLGSMVAGLVGRLVSPHVQPMLLYSSAVVFGAIGHVIAGVTTRLPLDDAYIAGALSALARPMPLDYLAGALLGVSFGLGWARSFLHHEDVPAAANA